jgi:hypothetical protein
MVLLNVRSALRNARMQAGLRTRKDFCAAFPVNSPVAQKHSVACLPLRGQLRFDRRRYHRITAFPFHLHHTKSEGTCMERDSKQACQRWQSRKASDVLKVSATNEKAGLAPGFRSFRHAAGD